MIFERNQRKIERLILIKSMFGSLIQKYVQKKTEEDFEKNRTKIEFFR